jgi:hypothetical protein
MSSGGLSGRFRRIAIHCVCTAEFVSHFPAIGGNLGAAQRPTAVSVWDG